MSKARQARQEKLFFGIEKGSIANSNNLNKIKLLALELKDKHLKILAQTTHCLKPRA